MEKNKALIVDDDRDTANFLRIALGLIGFECRIVNSAKAALSYLATVEPDIVTLDMQLGTGLGGNDLLYQIRSNPRFDETRVIVITAYPSMAEPVHDIADLVLIKPIEIDQLKTLTERIMNKETKSFKFRDPATNLYNFKFFITRLEHALERAKRRSDFLFAIVVLEFTIDLADEVQVPEVEKEFVIKILAERMQGKFRPTDTIGRMDDERIIALYEELKTPEDVFIIIQRIRSELNRSFELNGRNIQFHSYAGAVTNNVLYEDAQQMINAALQVLANETHSDSEGYLRKLP